MPTINLKQLKQYKPGRSLHKARYQKVYQDPRWKKIRAAKIQNNPLCEICEQRGRTVQADEVHHIIPFDIYASQDEINELAFDYDNLLSLCIPCHKTEQNLLKNDKS